MLACSECAFKGSGSGDLVTQAVDDVGVQVFIQGQLSVTVLCDVYYQNHTDLERGTVTESNITSMKLKPED